MQVRSLCGPPTLSRIIPRPNSNKRTTYKAVKSVTKQKGIFKKITRLVGKAIGDFDLIQEGDRVLVALSGGKDSWSLLYALKELQRKAPIRYEIGGVTIHPGPEAFNCAALQERLSRDGIFHALVPGNIVTVVNENLEHGTNPCSFCSRLRRGILYTYAAREGWNKIALGHHLDDFVETLLMNLFFNGSIKGMSPNLVADDGKNRVIRPLVYVREDMTLEYAWGAGLPIIDCSCFYQGMGGDRRQWVKRLLNNIEREVPDVRANLLASMGRVRHRHLFAKLRKLCDETA
jgi:tRNA 2-thiocytidine biosynthesis protein TtcA